MPVRLLPPLLMLLLLNACAGREPAERMRELDWGMSRAAVRAAEPSEPVLEPMDRLIYHKRIADVPLTVTYRFGPEGLNAVHYFNRGGYHDENRYLADYERLKEHLIDRHGLPRLDRMAWRNRLFADDPERYGDAVAAGHLVYYSEWSGDDAKRVMALRGERLQVAHELVRTPPEED